ncbi:MAG: AI-2E family transporter [bacterium]|nr:AI-2E family transporter [bacterium]
MTLQARSAPLTILAIVVIGAALFILKPILIPLLIAIMIAYIISPLVEKLAQWKIPRIVTLLILFTLGFAALGYAVDKVIENSGAFVKNFPQYKQNITTIVHQYSAEYEWVDKAVGNLTQVLFSLPIGTTANTVFNSSLSFLSNSFLILLFVMYFGLSGHGLHQKIREAFPGGQGKKLIEMVSHINRDVNKYLVVHTAVSLATGISVWAICWYFQVPFAFLWGTIAFLLNYIPNIGSVISTIPPVATAAVAVGVTPALWVLGGITLAQLIWGNLVEPKIAGQSLGLSPLVILIFLVFWGWLWGIVGMILAIPIASVIKIVCSNVPEWKPISVLMGDR